MSLDPHHLSFSPSPTLFSASHVRGRMDAHMFTHTHTHTHTYTYIVHLHMHIHTHTHTHAHTPQAYANTYVCIYVHTCTYMYVHIILCIHHMHTHTYTHNTHTHTHKHTTYLVISARSPSIHPGLHSPPGYKIPQPSFRTFGDLVDVTECPSRQTMASVSKIDEEIHVRKCIT